MIPFSILRSRFLFTALLTALGCLALGASPALAADVNPPSMNNVQLPLYDGSIMYMVRASGTDPENDIASVTAEVSGDAGATWAPLGTITRPIANAEFVTFYVNGSAYPDGDTIRVRFGACDGSGNCQLPSAGITGSFIVDTHAPTGTASLLPAGATMSGFVELRATTSDTYSGIDNVAFQTSPQGTGVWTDVDADYSAPYRALFSTYTVPDGSYDVRAVSRDSFLNAGYIPLGVRQVDNTAPETALQDPGAFLAGSATFTADASDATAGIANVRFEIRSERSTKWTAIASANEASPGGRYSVKFSTFAYANGVYGLRVVATDKAGHSTTTSSISSLIANNGKKDSASSFGTLELAGDDASAGGVVTFRPAVDPGSQLDRPIGYQWERCNFAVTTCMSIPAATAAQYGPSRGDGGYRIRLRVISGDAKAYTTASQPVAYATSPTTARCTIVAKKARALVKGTKKRDVICVRAAHVRVQAGAGNDVIIIAGKGSNVDGGAGNDEIIGSKFADTIRGGAGNDLLVGLGGNDSIDGGAGNDSIGGGAGNDSLKGSSGSDRILGNGGNDVMAGGNGADEIDGGIGTDRAANAIADTRLNTEF